MTLAHRVPVKSLPTTLTDLLHRVRDLFLPFQALALRNHLVRVILHHHLDADRPLTTAMEALLAAAGVVTLVDPTADNSVHPITAEVDAIAAHLSPL